MTDTGRVPAETSAEHREERKVVTAVFADLVGSTALGERLDPEEVKLIVGEAVARMVHAVEEFGGTVKDLAGDGVLALFGAPTAHEDDEERAVRASLRIVEEIEAYGAEVARSWGIEGFSVRVGVNSGSVVLGALGAGERIEYTAFGDTVNTAARLQSVAEPGTVLVGAEVKRAVESVFDWGEPAEHTLKGKAQPVLAYPVRGAHAPSGRPAGLSEAVGLLGRESELEAVGQTLDEVLVGTGGIVFFTGEPGIGKSRLLRELQSRFRASPASGGRPLWIEGRCASYGESIPYWPFRDLLRSWLGVSTDDPELRVRVALRRRLEQLFDARALEIYPYLASMLGLALEPDAADRLAELSPEALQYRTFEVVGALLARLAQDGPVVVAIEDLHWADPTSVQLAERLLPLAEGSAVLLLATGRAERDHPFWAVKELAAREFPHRTRDLVLEPLSGDADRQLLNALVGNAELAADLEQRILDVAGGNPFFLEELVSSLVDSGALVREDESWRFDHEVAVEIPATVERVILARLDRLPPQSHELVVSASVLGRQFSLALLEGVSGDGELAERLHELQRLDLIREARRWPQPEYQFKHALIQEAAYRTMLAPRRMGLHRKAAEWLETQYSEHEEEVYGLLAHHWLQAKDEEKAIAYLTKAGDKARQEYALDEAIEHYRALLPLLEERGERQEVALVLFKLALALHTALRFREANAAYQRAFEHWTPPAGAVSPPTKTLRMAASYVPTNADPSFAGWWPDIQLVMQLFDRLVEAWPERTIVPSLAERWEISDDGLRYVFHLREGLRWSDGEPLTAHDVEYGIKRVLTPDDPGGSVSVYFVLENAQDYFFGRNADADRIGVRALDDKTVEFRLIAPAPYFMSVMNRPDGGPQPRHAIERHGDGWTEPEYQVVSGPFRVVESAPERLLLVRNDGYPQERVGNVAAVEYVRAEADEAFPLFEREELEMIRVMYTPRLADHVQTRTAVAGPLTWFAYLGFDHQHRLLADVELRRALAYGTDREAMAAAAPANLVVATGGVVPPALHGHTPEIALRFDPDRAREHLDRSRVSSEGAAGLAICGHAAWEPMLRRLVGGWKEVLGLDASLELFEVADERLRHETEVGTRVGTPLLAVAPIAVLGWLPGYPDPEYMLRLLLHSEALTNAGRYESERFDELIEQARRAGTDRERLELFHEADRFAVTDQVALIPLVYGRSAAFVQPHVHGWWEFAKSSASYADLMIGE
jgi:ABC-type transport system substrate-binding protein/class 3 adenylate cyclase